VWRHGRNLLLRTLARLIDGSSWSSPLQIRLHGGRALTVDVGRHEVALAIASAVQEQGAGLRLFGEEAW
jgi:hypothetical protein